MAEALLRIGVLLAIFASVFVVSQLALNAFWARRSHTRAINKRLRLLGQGNSREQIMAELRKNTPGHHPNLPPFIAKRLENLQRTIMAASLPVTPGQALLLIAAAFAILVALMLFLTVGAGFPINAGTLLLIAAIAFCVTFALPMLALSYVGQRRRKRIEQQFPVPPRAVPEQGGGIVENHQVDRRPAECLLSARGELQSQLEALTAGQPRRRPHPQVDVRKRPRISPRLRPEHVRGSDLIAVERIP